MNLREPKWLLVIPLGLAIAAVLTGGLMVKLGVALGCAGILLWTGLQSRQTEAADLGWVIAALALSAGGDWFLSNRGQRESYFLVGIGLFFGAHIGFLKFCWRRGRANRITLGSLLGAYLPYYWFWLRPAIPSSPLKAAVLAYLLISCLALSVACGLRVRPVVKVGFVLGIGLLVFSDTLISMNEFLKWRQGNRLILPTYYLAHLCISWAALTLYAPEWRGTSIAAHVPNR
jgi:uncharacterized membrane protein YhhN